MSPSPVERRPLRAGVARAVITPPIGIRMCGYTVQEECARSVERELTATALVLDDGEIKTALLACDILFIQSPHAERIRERIGRRLDIPASHVLLNASHTHLGPTLPGWQREDEDQARIQERYVAFLEETLAGVATTANDRLQPARIGAGSGSVAIGVNRRERMPEGGIMIGENPQGAVDREVSVVRLDALTGRPIATLMAVGCHTVVLGPKTSALSPDYAGPAREIVEAATGAPALFLQGAAGNINPACGIGAGGPEQYEDLARIGAMLGGEVLKTWGQIRTHRQRGPRRIVKSVAAISTWDYEPLPEACVEYFGVAEQRRTLSMAPLPDRETAEREVTRRRRERDAAEGRGAQNVARRLCDWAELVASSVAAGMPITRELCVWALRINDIGIVAVNGEPFAELSLEVKRRSPLSHTIFLGYSNGCLGYLPTPEAFAEGGMEVIESVRNYLLPAGFTREWGPAVVETCLNLLGQLEGQS
jgi:hypothetical protein